MLAFRLGSAAAALRTVLCLGAHCDDIEIGCGGTVLRLLADNPDLTVHWVVFSGTPVRREEARRAAERMTAGASQRQITIHEFRDGFFPYLGADIKRSFEQLKQDLQPDLIFTHCRGDLHQDHRLINELTWNTFRNHLILEYEIPKYDGDLGTPGMFAPLPLALCDRKIDILLDCYESQRPKHWFTRDLFMAILRLRGMEANAASGLAEAFYCRKGIL